MRESARMKRVSIRYAALFFVVFGLIFAALGAFVYQTVNANIFRAVDQQILMVGVGEDQSLATGTEVKTDANDESPAQEEAEVPPAQGEVASETPQSQIVEESLEENPQTVLLARASDGTVMDTFGIYSTYPNFFETLPFDPSVLDTAYLMEKNGHHYRAANYRVEPAADGIAYLQTIVNVDSEIAILEQFRFTLIVGLSIALLVCAGASYALSRKTLRPIADAWEKQTEFVQNASHELRTPLTVIRTTQELLLEEPHARIIDKFEDISITIEEAGRLSRLTKDLLALTTADAEDNAANMTELDLGALASGVAAAYEDLALAEGKTLTVRTSDNVLVQGDRDKLQQLLAILLDNALKYTEEGNAIRVSVEERGASALLLVSDNGVGVSSEDLSRVFDRFYRADKARSRETGGNGLGLSIAKSIMDAHGGAIKMTRNPSGGVTVTASFKKAAAR